MASGLQWVPGAGPSFGLLGPQGIAPRHDDEDALTGICGDAGEIFGGFVEYDLRKGGNAVLQGGVAGCSCASAGRILRVGAGGCGLSNGRQ